MAKIFFMFIFMIHINLIWRESSIVSNGQSLLTIILYIIYILYYIYVLYYIYIYIIYPIYLASVRLRNGDEIPEENREGIRPFVRSRVVSFQAFLA